jgi:hypothetical protein
MPRGRRIAKITFFCIEARSIRLNMAAVNMLLICLLKQKRRRKDASLSVQLVHYTVKSTFPYQILRLPRPVRSTFVLPACNC